MSVPRNDQRSFAALAAIMVISSSIVGCDGTAPTVDDKQQAKQEGMLDQATQEVGLPNIVNFSELKQVKRIYELRDDAKLPTWTYCFGIDGTPHFLFRSLGYGLPYSSQFSNPNKIAYSPGGTPEVLPQAEPNGLYMPAAAEGTWVDAVDPAGKEQVVYCEERVMVSPFPIAGAR